MRQRQKHSARTQSLSPAPAADSPIIQSSTQPFTLNIFVGEPVILGFIARRRLTPSWLLLFPVGCLATTALLAWLSGDFSQHHVGTYICRDFSVFLRLPKNPCAPVAPDSRFTFLRDLPTLLSLVLLSSTPYLMYRQWSGISHFLDNMNSRGLLTLPFGSRAVESTVARCNTSFARLSGFTPLAMLCAVSFVLLVSLSHERAGAYTLLLPRHNIDGASFSRFTWWADLSQSPANWALYLLLGSVCIYTILLQNIFGGRTVLLLWQLRNSVHYGADADNLDGNYGWSEARQVLRFTWVAILVHGISLALVALSLSRYFAIYLMPLLGQWLLTTPLYVGLPVYLTRRNISTWKNREALALQAQHRSTSDIVARTSIAMRLERVRSVSVLPFVGAAGAIVFAVTLVASIITVLQIIVALYFS